MTTLAELDRLAEPLHARVVTREGMETMTRLAYEKGLADEEQRVRQAISDVLPAMVYDLYAEKALARLREASHD